MTTQRPQELLDQFSLWIREEADPAEIPGAAAGVLERFIEDLLQEIFIAAESVPTDLAPHWIREQYNQASEPFAATLRQRIPEPLRHLSAQLLQLKLLEAELRLTHALTDWQGRH